MTGWFLATAGFAGSHRAGLHIIDWGVIALYAGVLVWVGWRASLRHDTTNEYFVGGSGFGSFAIGISMFVTLFSTISYLSGPGETVRYGPGAYLGLLIAVPFVYPVIAYWLVPALMKHRVVSLYQLFEYTLGPHIRTLGACLFLAYRTVWMGVLMRFAAEALSVILGVGPQWIPVITIVTGVIVIIYTSLGGLRAVMLADVIQFFVLFFGVLASIIVITLHFGGLGWFPTGWNPAWPKQPVFSTDLTVRLTLSGIALQLIIVEVAHGIDQTQMQRYMASGDVKRARRSVLVRLLGSSAVWTLLALLGVALIAFYQRYPGAMPEGANIQSFADRLFPYFIAHELPLGLSGLVVAGILAAGMSSLDSGVNAFTAVVLNDFIERRGRRKKTEAEHKRFAMMLAVVVGACVVFFSLFVGFVPGNYFEIAARTIRLFIPLELGVVLLALFVRFATPFGVAWGIIYGFTLGVIVSYWEVITRTKGISFTLYPAFILAVQLIASCLFSLIPVRKLSRGLLIVTSALLAALLGAIIALVLRSV